MFKKTEKKSLKKKSKLLVASIIAGSAIVFVCVAVLLVAHFYVNKLNLVSGSENFTANPVPTATAIENDDEDNLFGEEVTQEQLKSMQNEIDNSISSDAASALYEDDVFNVLVIGSDTRISGQRARSDSMVLLSVNKAKKRISITSFMRDIYLQIPGYGYNRLNAAYSYGGAELLLDTIELNFKIKIQKYVEFDFYSFIEFVDALGGVTVPVDDSDIENINNVVAEVNHYLGVDSEDGFLEKGGVLNLNGKQALGHVRNRSYVDGDFTRTEHQRDVVNRLFAKLFSLSPSEINDLLCAYLPQITTNLSEGEILSMLVYIPDYARYSINQLCVPDSKSFSYAKINGMSVLKLDFSKNVKAVQKTIYGDGTD
jgi:LCP family protein required for cell wall assembly